MKVIKKELPEKCRIICVSDIHTHAGELKRLLEKCGYDSENDFLFILGDILERGSGNLAALRYVMKLSENTRTEVIMGNNDTMCFYMAHNDSREKFLMRMECKPVNCYSEMASELGISDFSEDFDKKRAKVNEKFKNEIDFIENLPHAIETDNHIFVHAGIEDRTDWENTTPHFAMCCKRFVDLKHCLEKTVVCGHYPCYSLGRSNGNMPIIDLQRRVIDIDGGAGVKSACQLNAFIIKKDGGRYEYDTVFLPLGKAVTAKSDVKEKGVWKYSDFEKHSFTKIEGEACKGFVRLHNNDTGAEGISPENMFGESEGELRCWANLDSFPAVNKGETVSIFSESGDYYWGITERGEVGNIPKSVFDSEDSDV